MDTEKYISKYSNGKCVSAAQYITEIICEKRAKYNKEDLHYRFWVAKKWSAYYRNQIASANKLLTKYSAKAIIRALSDKASQNIYSLRAPHLVDIIERAEADISSQNETMTLVPNRKDDKTFLSNTKQKKDIISKLRELDNDC